MANVDEHDPVQGKLIHEYDGIYEADNGLPTWLTVLFFGTTAFAVLYWFYYQEYELGEKPAEAYAAAMQERSESAPQVSEDALREMAEDPEILAAGQELYAANCAACHADDGGGQIGPNLTDAYWIHGGSPSAIHDTIEEGVAAAGMPAWGPVLGAEGVQRVSAYVMSLQGEDVEGGKEPEGEEWKLGAGSEEEETEASDAPEEGKRTAAPEPEDASVEVAETGPPSP